ncbi:hypothetical protein ACVIGA_009082 [Bradyrhizobium sp. USDA 3240]
MVAGKRVKVKVAKASAKKRARNQASINLRGVNRILEAVGERFTPTSKVAFKKCLEVCAIWYNDAIYYNNGDQRKELEQYIGDLRTALGDVVELLDNKNIPPCISSYFQDFAPYSSLLTQIEELDPKLKRVGSLRSETVPVTGMERNFIESLQYQDHFKERSPFDWLAGVYLPEVFYLFFRVHAGWGKGKQFLSFAESCLREMKVRTGGGKYYSRTTISRAVRLNTPRRKTGPLVDRDVPDQLEWYRHTHLMSVIGLHLKTPIERARALLQDGRQQGR